MQSLALLIRTLQGNLGVSFIIFQPRLQSADTSSKSRMHTNYRGENTDKIRFEGATKYICY